MVFIPCSPISAPDPGEILAESTKNLRNPSPMGRDAVIIAIVASGLIGLYALFKAVSILAGLPFP